MNERVDGINTMGVAGASPAAPGAAVGAAAEVVARRRGRPRKDGTNAASAVPGAPVGLSQSASGPAVDPAIAEAMFDPAAWEGLVAAPANVALAVTGRKLWNLEREETKTLAVQASLVARVWVVADPKWLALSMLCISVATIYGGRIAAHMAEVSREKAATNNTGPKPSRDAG